MQTDKSLPHDVLSYRDEPFYELVRNQCGVVIEEIFKLQKIRSVQSLLRIDDVLAFINYDSADLHDVKQKVAFRLSNGKYQIKCDVITEIDLFLRALKDTKDDPVESRPVDQADDPVKISQDLLRAHPILISLIQYFSTREIDDDGIGTCFLKSFLENITQNLPRSKCSYRYNAHVQRFAVSLFILAGRNAYNFVRMNIPCALPSISTVQLLIDKEDGRMIEGDFRFGTLKRHLASADTDIPFCSEDCTAVVSEVSYDANSNSFVGFSLPLDNGLPIREYYRTESLAQLKNWFATVDKSNLLNIHMVQPIASIGQKSSPFIVSAYGTNSRYTSLDILRRWIWIFEQCLGQGIRIIGFSTDGDPKYMKAMKLISGFFASLPNIEISGRRDAFEVSVPVDWSWFFLRRRQLVLCFQDPIHICTKLRNRLLSSTAEMFIGSQRVSMDALSELIASGNKLVHGLVKSDIYPRDKQNFASCEKISSNSAISALEEISDSLATCLYLRLIRSVITAYIDRATPSIDRVYHAWFSAFLCRIWWAWLIIKVENDSEELLTRVSPKNSSQSSAQLLQKLFITSTSFQSVEMNAHQLTYLILLVIEKSLPMKAIQICLFHPQTCESTFRSARGMSGAFSSVVNFPVAQFLRRAEKLSVLNRIKSGSETNISVEKTTSLQFPRHHKQSSQSVSSPSASAPPSASVITKAEIERVVSSAFDDALQSLSRIGILSLLRKKKIHTFRSLNNFILERMNSVPKTVDRSSFTDASADSDSESDGSSSSSNTIDHRSVTEDEDEEEEESQAYHLRDVSESSLHGVRIVDVDFSIDNRMHHERNDES